MRRTWAWTVVVVGVLGASAAGCTVSKIGDVAGRPDVADAADTADTAAEEDAEDAAAEDTAPEADAADAVDAEEVALDTGLADTEEADTRVPPVCPWVGYGEGLKGGSVSWVGFDPRVTGVMFAVSGGLLSRSQDHGETWARWSDREDGFGMLAFPADDPKGVLSTSGGGLLASADAGVTWQTRALQGFGLRSLLVHPTSPQRVYAGTAGAGILRSDDQGDSWMAVNVGVPLAEVRALAAPADRPAVALAGLILLNPNLGLSNNGQILFTDNGGLSWTVALDGVGWANDLVYCDDDTVYAAVRKGVAKSVDGGRTFALVPAFANLDALHVAASPDCETVYTMVYQKGMYRSFDGGDTHEGPFTTGLELEPIRQRTNNLVVDPLDPTRLFASTYAGLFKSEDAAASWEVIDSGNGVAITGLSASPAAPARLVATSWGSGPWLRHGPDSEWVRVPTALVPRDFLYGAFPDPADAQRLFLGTADDLWRSTDGGTTYASVGVRNNVLDLEYLPSGDLLAATQTGGVFRSADGGSNWASSNGGLAAFPTAAGTFIDTRHLARTAANTLYLGTNGGGLYQSVDAGVSWTRVAAGQGVDTVTALEVGPGDPEPLYAVVANRGVIKSVDGGATWTDGSTGLASLAVTDLVIDPETGELFAATRRDGVFRSDDAEHWEPLDRWCLPAPGFDALALITDAEGTWLVGAVNGGSVWRDKLR